MTSVLGDEHSYIKLIETWGSDERIIEAARMSTDKGFQGWGPKDEPCSRCHGLENMFYRCPRCRGTLREPGDEQLQRYLWEHKHATPFEMAGAIVEVQAPIFVFREWHRHRTQCVAGSVPLVFERPIDGRAYQKTMQDVVKSFQDLRQKARLQDMRLRGASELVQIKDAWYSGVKLVYLVYTKFGAVKVSADHVFKTPEGPRRITDGLTSVLAMASVGQDRLREWPSFTSRDVQQEEWRRLDESYDVSSLGRVRSWITPARTRRLEPKMKQQTRNKSGRAVVNLWGHTVVQVSHLVARVFLGYQQIGLVLHKDDNPLNNRETNLYIGSVQDNTDDQYVNLGRRKLREVPVEVRYVKAAGEEDTFDLEVSGDHWFCANNLLVHNSYNELSARYTALPDMFYVPSVDRLLNAKQGQKNKQGSEGGFTDDDARTIRTQLESSYRASREVYEHLLAQGVAREMARLVVPVAQYSRMRASANLRNWLGFLSLRLDTGAQWEIRQYANALATILEAEFPRTMELFYGKTGT